MNLIEFKAWFLGFSEGVGDAPTAEQWQKIKAKVAEIAPGTCYTGIRSRSAAPQQGEADPENYPADHPEHADNISRTFAEEAGT